MPTLPISFLARPGLGGTIALVALLVALAVAANNSSNKSQPQHPFA